MKVALICIACNEDHYIKEWISYHKFIGIDDIYIYQNNWRFPFENNDQHVHLIEWDGYIVQLSAYDDFKDRHYSEYDFAAFLDCDEFICLKKHNNLKEFLNDYIEYGGVGLNWKNFGDSHLEFNGNYNIISRFTLAQKGLHRNFKTIVNLNKLKNNFHFIGADAINLTNTIININKTHYLNGNFDNTPEENDIAQLNHYRKTRTEFYDRRKNGPPDQKISQTQLNNQYKQFDIEFPAYNHEKDIYIQQYVQKYKFKNINK